MIVIGVVTSLVLLPDVLRAFTLCFATINVINAITTLWHFFVTQRERSHETRREEQPTDPTAPQAITGGKSET